MTDKQAARNIIIHESGRRITRADHAKSPPGPADEKRVFHHKRKLVRRHLSLEKIRP